MLCGDTRILKVNFSCYVGGHTSIRRVNLLPAMCATHARSKLNLLRAMWSHTARKVNFLAMWSHKHETLTF